MYLRMSFFERISDRYFVLGGAFTVGTAVGIAIAVILLILLFRPDPYKNKKIYSKRSVQAA